MGFGILETIGFILLALFGGLFVGDRNRKRLEKGKQAQDAVDGFRDKKEAQRDAESQDDTALIDRLSGR